MLQKKHKKQKQQQKHWTARSGSCRTIDVLADDGLVPSARMCSSLLHSIRSKSAQLDHHVAYMLLECRCANLLHQVMKARGASQPVTADDIIRISTTEGSCIDWPDKRKRTLVNVSQRLVKQWAKQRVSCACCRCCGYCCGQLHLTAFKLLKQVSSAAHKRGCCQQVVAVTSNCCVFSWQLLTSFAWSMFVRCLQVLSSEPAFVRLARGHYTLRALAGDLPLTSPLGQGQGAAAASGGAAGSGKAARRASVSADAFLQG